MPVAIMSERPALCADPGDIIGVPFAMGSCVFGGAFLGEQVLFTILMSAFVIEEKRCLHVPIVRN